MGRILIVLGLATALLIGLCLWTSRSRVPESLSPAPLPERSLPDSTPTPLQTPERMTSRVVSESRDHQTPTPPTVREATKADDLVVRVLDPAGEPVSDVRLLLGPSTSFANDRRERGDAITRATGMTGRAQFPDVRERVESSLAASVPWTLLHDIPFEHPPSVRIDRVQLSENEIVSTQPFTGSLEVIVRDVDGVVAADGTVVNLTWADGDKAQDPAILERRPHWKAETQSGGARFPHVELGRMWEASAFRAGWRVRSRAQARGPVNPHDAARIEIVVGADHPIVALRAVDERSEPLANAALEVTLDEEGLFFRRGDDVDVQSDYSGRFRIDLKAHPLSTQSSLFITSTRPGTGQLSGRKILEANLQPGVNEGGDVMLISEATLVDGKVVDEAGRPVAVARVIAEHPASYKNKTSPSPFQTRKLAGQGSQGGPKEAEFKSSLDTLIGESEEDGHFALHGAFPERQFRLRAEKGTLRSQTIQVQEHSRNVLLVLVPYSTISGRLLVDPGIDATSFQFGVVDAQGKRQHLDIRRGHNGSFALEPIPADIYDLVLDSRDGISLAKIEGVNATRDVDVGTIDLRDQVHRFDVLLVGADAGTKLSGFVAWRPTGSQENWKNQGFEGDHIELQTQAKSIDAWVRPNGYRGEVLRGIVDRREMQLAPALRVRIELHLAGSLPAEPYQIGSILMRDDQRVAFALDSAFFGEPGRALTFSASEPGRMRVCWYLSRRDGSGASKSKVVSALPAPEIDVLDVPDEQVFPVALDAQRLAQLLSSPPF